jgi:hypothetical protein
LNFIKQACCRKVLAPYVESEFVDILYNKVHDQSFRGGIHIISRFLAGLSEGSRGEIMRRLMKNPFMVQPCGMEFLPNDKFYDHFNNKIQQMISGGILQHLIAAYDKFLDPKFYESPQLMTKEYLNEIYPKSFPPEGRKVLTMGQLESGFVIIAIFLLLSLVVFLLEWSRTWKDLVIWICILDAYYKLNRETKLLRISSSVDLRKILKRQVALIQAFHQVNASFKP